MKCILLNLTLSAAVFSLSALQPTDRNTESLNIANMNNQFAIALFNELTADNDDNVFISPFSISTALAMTYAGADGETAEAMKKTMRFADNTASFHTAYSNYLNSLNASAQDKIDLKVANRLWAQEGYPFRQNYLNLSGSNYGADVASMDFRMAAEPGRIKINRWVADHTAQRIQDLLPPGAVDENTRMVLTNAIYFKANWKKAFDAERTRERNFHPANAEPVPHLFMHATDFYSYAETSSYQAIRIPYEGSSHSLVVVLPANGHSIHDIQQELSTGIITSMLSSRGDEVKLALPKFKMTVPLSLRNTLKSMGMEAAFGDGANFSRMSEDNDLAISDVIHKAFIEFDEEGTEAAAATAVVMMQTSSANTKPRIPKQFIADRPFLYYIMDDAQQAILFMGRLMNP